MRKTDSVADLRDLRGETEQELGLDGILYHHLMHHVDDGVSFAIERVAAGDVATEEDPRPRNQHVVEDDNTVHLLEARREGRVEIRPSDIEAVAAEKSQTPRIAGCCE